MASKVTTLYEDSAKTNALYPRTKVSAISDNSSNSLQQLLDAKQDGLIAGSGITVNGANISSYTDMDLLWENASPTSEFAGQTINIDLTNYNILIVLFAISTGQAINISVAIDKNEYPYVVDFCYDYMYHRYISVVTDSGMQFGNCERTPSYGGAFVTQNVSMIPIKVIGLK